jgi:hypothetical protein
VTSLVSRKKQYADLQSEDVRFVQSRNVHFSGGSYVRVVNSPRFEFKIRRNEDSFNAIT